MSKETEAATTTEGQERININHYQNVWLFQLRRQCRVISNLSRNLTFPKLLVVFPWIPFVRPSHIFRVHFMGCETSSVSARPSLIPCEWRRALRLRAANGAINGDRGWMATPTHKRIIIIITIIRQYGKSSCTPELF